MSYLYQHKTAILVFALSADEETKQKPIKNGRRLFHALSKSTLGTVRRSRLPYFLITEKEQKGSSFGERFCNAIQSVYDKGFDGVIAIGNDAPHLKVSHIKDAATLLKQGKVVLGPSADGGFYLMGLQKSAFNPNLFQPLPWQTRRLANCFKEVSNHYRWDLAFLETLQDIDVSEDLFAVLSNVRELPSDILRIIQSLLSNPFPVFWTRIFSLKLFPSNINKNRGSPYFQLS